MELEWDFVNNVEWMFSKRGFRIKRDVIETFIIECFNRFQYFSETMVEIFCRYLREKNIDEENISELMVLDYFNYLELWNFDYKQE